MLYSLGVPDIVGPFDIKDVRSSWANGAAAGNLFSDGNNQPLYTKVRDPQCTNGNYVAPSLSGFCTLNALRNSRVRSCCKPLCQAIAEHLGRTDLKISARGQRTWPSKTCSSCRDQELHRSCRCDECVQSSDSGYQRGFFAATGGTPDLNLQSAVPFGIFNNKIGNRRFQLKARVDF